MGWIIVHNRLAYKNGEEITFPSAEEIFSLSKSKNIGRPAAISLSEKEKLGIRFSKLGANVKISLSFLNGTNQINLRLYAVRGDKKTQIKYENFVLQDNVIIENTWYSLLTNWENVKVLLYDSFIETDGKISLKQYILLKKKKVHFENIDIDDQAESVLANHPVKDCAGKMPIALKANLYPYQQKGYQWMRFITEEHCGCILGDEMGLGKTLQIISLIADRKQNGYGNSLIIAPVSLLENWRREFEKFTTGLKVIIHHGVKRTGLYTALMDYDTVIISYNTAVSDLSLLKMIDWDLVVVDEAQNIKNPIASRTKAIKNIPRHVAIAVTGTPFENHISDLWSLMDFVAPGCFGKLTEFQADYSDDVDGAKALEPILSPIMIRRKVADVARDLPERIDVPQILQMTDNEVQAYEEVREKILEEFDGKNATLSMLQKLRMYCTHPHLLDEAQAGNPVLNSRKYERLCEILEEIISLDEKVILFTSYNKMFEILQEDIPRRFGIKVMKINGSTPVEERQRIIDEFSDIIGTTLLVLNPRAAGTGLNITAANRVIHYNLEWNPALEDQASARAYRRGQTKPVFVYRFFYKGTVEEIINERISKKRNMFDTAVVGTDGENENSEDIIRALMIAPGGVQNGK